VETGLKISDVLGIKLKEVEEIDYKYIKEYNGKKISYTFLSDELREKLIEFVENDRLELIRGKDRGLVFQGLSRQNYRVRFGKYGLDAGIEKNVYPNMIRNSFNKEILTKEGALAYKERVGYDNLDESGIFRNRHLDEIRKKYMEIGLGDN